MSVTTHSFRLGWEVGGEVELSMAKHVNEDGWGVCGEIQDAIEGGIVDGFGGLVER